MTDLPTRLRARADLHDTLTAVLMRDAADEIERMHEAIKTEANDTREMAEGIGSLEAKACLEAVADNLDAARWAWLATSTIVKPETGL